jgi:tetratricopeptide (TPR) repeat protein
MAGYHFIENERSEKLTKLEPLLPKNDPRILETMETLAAVCHNQAKYAQAEGWYRKIIAIREITDHALSPKTLWAQIFLCETLNCQSKDFEANEILQSINTAIMTQFEPSHSIVLAFLTIKILVAFGLGDARGQEVHCRELVQITLEAFGPRHSATLDAIAMLTTPLFNEGSVEESENLLWAMMQLSNEVKEIEAEVTIGRMCYSADLLYQRRQYASSVELCRAQLERAKITLGDGHLVTMRCSSRLGVGLRQLGNLNESEEILRDTIKMESEVLGSEYWQTRDSMYELGWTLMAGRQYAEAMPWFQKAFWERSDSILADTRRAKNACNSLGACYERLGLYQDARDLYLYYINQIRIAKGGDHPHIVEVQDWISGLP